MTLFDPMWPFYLISWGLLSHNKNDESNNNYIFITHITVSGWLSACKVSSVEINWWSSLILQKLFVVKWIATKLLSQCFNIVIAMEIYLLEKYITEDSSSIFFKASSCNTRIESDGEFAEFTACFGSDTNSDELDGAIITWEMLPKRTNS